MKHQLEDESFAAPKLFEDEKTGSKMTGGFLVMMGLICLLGTSGISILGRSPWLLVGLLPIYWIGMNAYKQYQEDGRVTGRVVSTLLFCLLPFAFIVAIFFGINTAMIWPLGIIVVGVSFILFGSRK